MKTTIKINLTDALTVRPNADRKHVDFGFRFMGVSDEALTMTPDQCGALIFALEMALEANGINRQMVAA